MAAADARHRSLRARTADAAHRRHEHGFPRRPRLAADEQHAAAARVDGDELPRCPRARAQEPHDHDRRDGRCADLRRQAGRRRDGDRRWRPPRYPGRRNHHLRRRHSLAGLPAARRHRPGGGVARARHRRRRRSARRRPQSAEPSDRFRRRASAPRCAPAGGAAAAPDYLPALFLGSFGRGAERHVHRRPQQVVVERARRADRQFLCGDLQAGLARPRHAEIGRRPANRASSSISPARRSTSSG